MGSVGVLVFGVGVGLFDLCRVGFGFCGWVLVCGFGVDFVSRFCGVFWVCELVLDVFVLDVFSVFDFVVVVLVWDGFIVWFVGFCFVTCVVLLDWYWWVFEVVVGLFWVDVWGWVVGFCFGLWFTV